MIFLRTSSLEREGIIQYVEPLASGSDSIRLVVKSKMEGKGRMNDHAMLNIDDDLFVSLERYHSIVTSFAELSQALHKNINQQNVRTIYDTAITFSRYGMNVVSAISKLANKRKGLTETISRTICRSKLRMDYDWIYVSGLNMQDDEDKVIEYRERIIKYLDDNLGTKYSIGNYRSSAMKITRYSKKEQSSVVNAIDKNRNGVWILHSPKKILYHNGFSKQRKYSFMYDYEIIADGAFRSLTRLEHISIPNTVKFIGCGAFANCLALEDIHLPENLQFIGNRCFSNCSQLKYVVIPNTVTEIGNLIFLNCESLEYVVIPNELKHIGWNVFEGCRNDIKIYINEVYAVKLKSVLSNYIDKVVETDEETINSLK